MGGGREDADAPTPSRAPAAALPVSRARDSRGNAPGQQRDRRTDAGNGARRRLFAIRCRDSRRRPGSTRFRRTGCLWRIGGPQPRPCSTPETLDAQAERGHGRAESTWEKKAELNRFRKPAGTADIRRWNAIWRDWRHFEQDGAIALGHGLDSVAASARLALFDRLMALNSLEISRAMVCQSVRAMLLGLALAHQQAADRAALGRYGSRKSPPCNRASYPNSEQRSGRSWPMPIAVSPTPGARDLCRIPRKARGPALLCRSGFCGEPDRIDRHARVRRRLLAARMASVSIWLCQRRLFVATTIGNGLQDQIHLLDDIGHLVFWWAGGKHRTRRAGPERPRRSGKNSACPAESAMRERIMAPIETIGSR